MTILLLTSGGVLFLVGALTGAAIMRYGIGLGNRLSISSVEEIPIDEKIVTIKQGNTD